MNRSQTRKNQLRAFGLMLGQVLFGEHSVKTRLIPGTEMAEEIQSRRLLWAGWVSDMDLGRSVTALVGGLNFPKPGSRTCSPGRAPSCSCRVGRWPLAHSGNFLT